MQDIDEIDRELDALLTQRKAAKAKPPRDPLDDLWDAASREPVKPQVWRPTASVALVHEQVCITCGGQHALFVGWFTEQLHISDGSARRLVAGRSSALPSRVERHQLPPSEWCPSCIESQLLIEHVTKEPPCP